MYLHVGNNKTIRKKNIIGIFDFDNATFSQITRRYLTRTQPEGLLEVANDELPKSFILYFSDADGFYKVCFSQISTAALKFRLIEV